MARVSFSYPTMAERRAHLGVESTQQSPLFPAEDNLKDGQQLKQLLLKALTLMLDAAESYAKVTTG